MKNEYICRYCGRECKNDNSLRNHERLCKSNPNRQIIIYNGVGFSKYRERIKSLGITPPNYGKIAVNKDHIIKYISKDELQEYINNGWEKGANQDFKLKMKIVNRNRLNPGKANNEEDEKERRKKISETMKKNPRSGGRRQGSGRGKKGWYKGIFCDSSWELAYLIYCLDHNINIKRCDEKREYIYNGEKHAYLPDFVVEGRIVEIKGYKTNQWLVKLSQNPDILVLYEDDLKPYLDYVINKYGKDYIKLYER